MKSILLIVRFWNALVSNHLIFMSKYHIYCTIINQYHHYTNIISILIILVQCHKQKLLYIYVKYIVLIIQIGIARLSFKNLHLASSKGHGLWYCRLIMNLWNCISNKNVWNVYIVYYYWMLYCWWLFMFIYLICDLSYAAFLMIPNQEWCIIS